MPEVLPEIIESGRTSLHCFFRLEAVKRCLMCVPKIGLSGPVERMEMSSMNAKWLVLPVAMILATDRKSVV